jgi:hypothetical protein
MREKTNLVFPRQPLDHFRGAPLGPTRAVKLRSHHRNPQPPVRALRWLYRRSICYGRIHLG